MGAKNLRRILNLKTSEIDTTAEIEARAGSTLRSEVAVFSAACSRKLHVRVQGFRFGTLVRSTVRAL